MNVKAVTTQLLQRFRVDAFPGQDVCFQSVPIPKPRGGMRLKLSAA